jgi:hypothetical protein
MINPIQKDNIHATIKTNKRLKMYRLAIVSKYGYEISYHNTIKELENYYNKYHTETEFGKHGGQICQNKKEYWTNWGKIRKGIKPSVIKHYNKDFKF